MPYVDLPHARIHYDSAGDGDTGVLLIMGFGVPGHMWLNQIPALSARHRVVWFDNAGAGQTRRTKGRPTMARMAADAVAVLDHLELAEAHIVGVSMGGMIAQELALRHRRRVRSLSLVVTHAGGLRQTVPPLGSLALFASGFLGPRKYRARALERLIFPDAYRRTSVKGSPVRAALRDEVASSASARDRLLQISAVLGHKTGPRLHTLAGTPTLVVRAALDRLVRPKASDFLHARIPGSRMVDFADAGHAILLQCADKLNATLLDHFHQVDTRSRLTR